MARSNEPLQSEAGYIDARPETQINEISCNARPDHTFGSEAGVPSRRQQLQQHPGNWTIARHRGLVPGSHSRGRAQNAPRHRAARGRACSDLAVRVSNEHEASVLGTRAARNAMCNAAQ
jgi:hypothetical protein